jgi:natural product precursor
MKLQKINLANIQGKLNRKEMKNIMAGSGTACRDSGWDCFYYESGTGTVVGTCETNSRGSCVCNAGTSSIVSSDCKI